MVLILFFTLIFILLSVAFFTLFEISALGGIHVRFGPNKVGVGGYFQPFGDFVKLFKKTFWLPSKGELVFYFLSPVLSVFLGLAVWVVYENSFFFVSFSWSVMLFFCFSSLVVYFFLFSGWSSGSVYSSIGSFRSSAQMVSYEVIMVFVAFSLIIMFWSYDLVDLIYFFSEGSNFFFLTVLFFLWVLSCLAEAMRAPFDFSEGESELVSGFNTEYQGGFFSFIFIAEYSFMLFLSFYTVFLFFGFKLMIIKILFLVSIYIFVRGAFPRLRFDFLMLMMWSNLLPLVLGAFGFCLSMSLI